MAKRRSGAALAGALAAAGTAAAWWQLLRRPLPKTEGTRRVSGLSAPVEIARDRFGVPRVSARDAVDLCFGHGYVHAQDRLWQMELYRRFTSGRVSAFAGEEGLQLDRLIRTLGFRRVAEREVDTIPSRDLELLTAYSAGVNAAIDSLSALPFELQLLRIEPEPWTPADSLAAGKILALGFSTNMESELFRAELIRKVGPEKAARLEPSYPQGNPVVLDPENAWNGDGLGLAAQLAEVRDALGLSLQPAGSNNWAVSGARSVTGRPLLAGDPHITTSMPNVWHQVELSAPGIELQGVTWAAFPGLLIGQSPHVAWSFTNSMADVQDLFVERVRENGNGPEYEFEGEWRPLAVRSEEISVRGRSEPERIEVRETHHGPLITDAVGAEADEPLALSFTALREPFFTGLGIDAAGEVRNGADLVKSFGAYSVPVMNMVWADSSGNIGFKMVGKLPRRRGGCPDLPKPGWTGEHEWEGYVPYEENPELVNPDGGVVVTANNRIAPDDFPHHVTSEYLDGFRAARIEQLLRERERHSLDDFERIQCDLFSIPGGIVVERLSELEPAGERERRALELLRGWDQRLDPDTVPGTIYSAFMVHFARLVSEAAIGDPDYAERWRSRSQLGFTAMTSAPWRFAAHMLDLWEEGDEELVGGRSWDGLAIESLQAALDDLEQRHGSDPEGWKWGDVHGLRFPHTLADGEHPLQPAFERLLSRRLRAGGGQETVCQIGFVPHAGDYEGHWAPSFRLLADAGDASRSRWQHFTGQSGHPGSPHYDDLMDDWLAGRTNPVRQPAVETLRLEPS